MQDEDGMYRSPEQEVRMCRRPEQEIRGGRSMMLELQEQEVKRCKSR